MLKKILYVIASLFLGFMLISSVIVTNFYSVFQSYAAEAVGNKDYTSAERFFSRVIDQNKFYSSEVNGTIIEVYSALNDGIEFVYDEENKKTDTSYYTLESSIQFTLFNLPESFALVNNEENSEDKKQGGVKLIVGEDKSVFFPYVTETVDYYGFVESYSFLPLSIPYAQYTAALSAANITDAVISGAVIIDGNGVEQFTLTFEEGKNPSFNTQFHTNFNEILVRYNQIQLDYAKGLEIEESVGNAIKAEYDAVVDSNENYLEQHDYNLIYGSFDFLFPVISSAVIFLAADILLAWLLFRKKKAATYIPPYQKKQATPVQREPEQFNRDVFNVEEYDVAEEEVVTEETPSGE